MINYINEYGEPRKASYSWEQWVEKYKPIWKDPEGDMHYETFGADLDHIKRHKDSYVWTYHDDSSVTAGFHIVNRMGYYIAEIPHKYEGKFAVVVDLELESITMRKNYEDEEFKEEFPDEWKNISKYYEKRKLQQAS